MVMPKDGIGRTPQTGNNRRSPNAAATCTKRGPDCRGSVIRLVTTGPRGVMQMAHGVMHAAASRVSIERRPDPPSHGQVLAKLRHLNDSSALSALINHEVPWSPSLAFAATLLAPLGAAAQAWPAAKPIRLVIPFPAGGANRHHRPHHRPEARRRARPAGGGGQQARRRRHHRCRHRGQGPSPTATRSSWPRAPRTASARRLNPKLPYDAFKDFAPVAQVANAPERAGGRPRLPRHHRAASWWRC